MSFKTKVLSSVILLGVVASALFFVGYRTQKPCILVGVPIRQKPAILKEFLTSLQTLDQKNYTLDYFFVDDNVDPSSSQLLADFRKNKEVLIVKADALFKQEEYVCNENTHYWTEGLIWKVAAFKDEMIAYARKENYDYLFLIDSDILLHPKTIDRLIITDKEIISNIFWTSWNPGSPLLPQVWMKDQYTQYEAANNEKLSDEEIQKRSLDFLLKLRVPGTYEVGGLGACTLISKSALKKSIGFQRIKNISLWGEDRHFCIRASALGIPLFVDSFYPAYHIYRESALSDVEHFKRSCQRVKNAKPRITLSMVMKNEGGRYLRRVLENARRYITDAVIIDDASTDNSVALCREVLAGIPLVIIQNEKSKFTNEIDLRMQQWNETIKTDPDWILVLDADEIFEDRFGDQVRQLIATPQFDAYYFKLYDLWDETHYREDQYWQAHQHFRPFLVRYRPDIPYVWATQTAQHCGRMPTTILGMLGCACDLRLKHYGWAKPEDRIAKYQRYKQLDPDAKFGIKEQYESILDPLPNLVVWRE